MKGQIFDTYCLQEPLTVKNIPKIKQFPTNIYQTRVFFELNMQFFINLSFSKPVFFINNEKKYDHSQDNTLTMPAINILDTDPQMVDLKYRKYGRIDSVLHGTNFQNILGRRYKNSKLSSIAIIRCCYVNEDYYDYFNGTDINILQDSNDSYDYLDPNSHHNINKPFQKGQISSLWYTRKQIEKRVRINAKARKQDKTYKKGYFALWCTVKLEVTCPKKQIITDVKHFINLIHVKAYDGLLSQKQIEEFFELSKQYENANNETEKAGLKNVMKNEYIRLIEKKKYESECRVILSRVYNSSDPFEEFGYVDKLYDYVSDRYYFNFTSNQYEEFSVNNAISKLLKFTDNYDHLAHIDSVKAQLNDVIATIMYLTKFYPSVVFKYLDIFSTVVGLNDEKIYVFMLDQLKMYILMNEELFDLKKVFKNAKSVSGGYQSDLFSPQHKKMLQHYYDNVILQIDDPRQ